MSDSLVCSEHGHRIPCFDCVKRGLDAIPLTKSGMTDGECLALIERDREALRAENARLMGLVGEAMKEAERIRSIIATASDRSRDEAKAWANSEYGTQQAAAYRALIDVQNAIDAKPEATPTDPAPPTDYRADAIASHLWLSQAGVPAAKTLVERVKGLVEQRDEARDHLRICEEQIDALGEANEQNVRMEPLRSVVGDYDWTGAKADGVLPEGAEQKVIDAFAYVEAAELKAKEADRG